VNIFGGFLVTQRMLAMYKKKVKVTNDNDSASKNVAVIAGLDPAIHPASQDSLSLMDARVKPAHERGVCIMNASLSSNSVSRGGGAVHPVAARAFQSGLVAARQSVRHGRHGDRGRHQAREPSADGFGRLDPRRTRHCHRGTIGAVIARRVPMTSMPELVAAFHSLVGMAAVLVAAGAFYAPEAFDIGTRATFTSRAWSKCRSASPSAP